MQLLSREQVRFYSGVLFLLAVVGSLIYGSMVVRDWLKDEQRMPVQVIDFSGQYEHINIARLERKIRRSQPGSFFELDVNEVFELIESQPWVYRASVRKQWPNRLKIYLVEQQPVARWNDDMLLNPYGDTFESEGITLSLPQLFGPGGSEKTALEGYNAMKSLLATSSMSIAELSLSERFAWQLQLTSGIKLNLGRKEFIDRLQRFIDVFPLLSKQDKPVKYVDLRYDTGLAVGWQSDENDNEQS
ncbi:FtsQ-type POTRA domain-containing protein [Salinimonas sp. HHU 13199]|uniref:Cell division protein FtsQ n=1 Tax=Salinimonas profundi TaxID=2729140 RepID=A0ABR8LNV7_9ALTE|nr:cell division protein FtsQ/DivIB [Salinimonas profundi]MBD3586107.1 FtsQ-type POTRA domain-containing protein [Salinimonas profundi]